MLLPVSRDWATASARLHERVLEASYDSLASSIAHLHRPYFCDGEMPTCHGCDQDSPISTADAVWPCRTYTLVAETVLRTKGVEQLLTSWL